MAQHDYVIDNQTGLNFRADLNSVLQAIASLNSGSAEPTTTFPYMFWADTNSGYLKQRNTANNAWISVLSLSTGKPALAVPIDTATGAAELPVGTEGQRPTGAVGKIRFNSDSDRFEGHNGTSWTGIGGGATGAGSDEVFMENGTTVTTSYTLTTGKNAASVGPITINSGITVTIPSAQRWVIL